MIASLPPQEALAQGKALGNICDSLQHMEQVLCNTLRTSVMLLSASESNQSEGSDGLFQLVFLFGWMLEKVAVLR